MKEKGPDAPSGDAALQRILAYGYGYPALPWLQPGDIRQAGDQEYWNWTADQIAGLYREHRVTVDALARAAGLARPWCVDQLAIERARDAEATAWRRREQER